MLFEKAISNGGKKIYGSRPKSVAIFIRRNEGFDHLSLDIVPVELNELTQPKIVTGVIQRRLRRIVWIAPQIAKVFCQHKRPIRFAVEEVLVFSYLAQSLCASCHVRGVRGIGE